MERRSIQMILCGFFTLYSVTVVAFRVLWPWRGQSKGLLARCCHFLRHRRKTLGPEEAETERRVREECVKRRGERAGTLLVIFSGATGYFSASTLISTAIDIYDDTSLLTVAIVNVNFFVKYTLAFFPRFMTPKVIDFCYLHSLATIIAALHTQAGAEGSSLASMRIITLVQFFFWCVFDLKPLLNGVGTLCMVAAEISASMQTGEKVDPLICFAYVSAFLTLLGIDYILEQGIRFEIQATDSKSELTAIQTMLDSICDVVVQLDGRLRLKHHSPKLADVLLQPACRNLEGADLRDYMATDADREVFSNRVTMNDGKTTQATVFHARLRDSTNTYADMEFFTVDFAGRDGDQHHIVGMREHTDIQPLASQQRVPLPPPVQVVIPRRIREENQIRPQRGTPSITHQGDLRSHRSDPTSGSEHSRSDDERSNLGSDQDSSISFSLREGSRGTPDIVARTPRVKATETAQIVKTVTTNYLLMSWALGAAGRCSCCPKHAAIADLQRVAASLAEGPCRPDYGPVTDWQCRRCGIKADEHRDPSRRTACLLCQSIDNSLFEPRAVAGAGTTVTL